MENSIYRKFRERLIVHGLDQYEADAELRLIFEEFTSVDPVKNPSGISDKAFESDKGREQLEKIEAAIGRLLSGEPVDYIIGKKWFYGLEFKVSPAVLVPRNDTELLCEELIKRADSMQKEKSTKIRIFDLCTGSGCIIISAAVMLSGKCEKAGLDAGECFSFTASDISDPALRIAKLNAKRHNVSVEFLSGDMFGALDEDNRFDIIVSNPPYIPAGEKSVLDRKVAEHEPEIALFGGKDGLDFYRDIAKNAKNYLNPGGMLMLEIGYDQGESVPKLLKAEGYEDIMVKKDYAGLDRMVICT